MYVKNDVSSVQGAVDGHLYPETNGEGNLILKQMGGPPPRLEGMWIPPPFSIIFVSHISSITSYILYMYMLHKS